MRSPNSEVSGQSLKAQEGLKVPKKAKNTVRSNGASGNTVQKKPQNAEFIKRKRAGSQAVLSKAVLQEAVLQEAVLQEAVPKIAVSSLPGNKPARGEASNTRPIGRKAISRELVRAKSVAKKGQSQEAKALDTNTQEAAINRPVKNRSAGIGTADLALIKDKKRHSDLAMRAAKRIKGSKNKRKTSHLVCHHLRMMLSSPEAQPRTSYYYPPAYMRRAVAVNERVGQYFLPI